MGEWEVSFGCGIAVDDRVTCIITPDEPARALQFALPAFSAWENEDVFAAPTFLRTSRAKAALIGGLVVLLAVFTWMVPPRAEWFHNILHHLNILPFMLAGLFFGWRGALKTILLAVVLQTPSIYRHWSHAPTDAQDQIVELSTFGFAGLIAGKLADRERLQLTRTEKTKRELERVYSELQQNIEQLKKAERLSAAGQLSASLAHEIRNPLASISGVAGILSRGQASEQSQRECLEILTAESQRLNKLLTNFLHFARPRLPRMQMVEAGELLNSVAMLAQHAASDRGVSLRLQIHSESDSVQCDPEQIKQLLLNLLLNAIEAAPIGTSVSLSGTRHQNVFRIEVHDAGEGIPKQALETIFEPFFTTKANGTGLGLAIAATIASQHNGTLTHVAEDNSGTTFALELPSQVAHAGKENTLAVAR